MKNHQGQSPADWGVGHSIAQAAELGLPVGDETYVGLDLRGFSWARLAGDTVHFVDCDLRGIIFDESHLRHAVFDECDLTGASFRWADLRGARFEYCHLDGADFEGANLEGTVGVPTQNDDEDDDGEG